MSNMFRTGLDPPQIFALIIVTLGCDEDRTVASQGSGIVRMLQLNGCVLNSPPTSALARRHGWSEVADRRSCQFLVNCSDFTDEKLLSCAAHEFIP